MKLKEQRVIKTVEYSLTASHAGILIITWQRKITLAFDVFVLYMVG